MSKLFFLVGLTILALASARVTREVATKDALDSIVDGMKTGFKSLEDLVLKAAGAKDSEDLLKKADEQFGAVKDKLTAFGEAAKHETEHIKDNEIVKELHSAVDKLTTDFKADHPALSTEIQEQFTKASTNAEQLVEKIKALEQTEEGKKMKDTLDKLVETAKNNLKELGEQFKATEAKTK